MNDRREAYVSRRRSFLYLLPSVFSELHIRVQITGKHLICLGKAAVGFVVEQCLFKIEDLTVLHRVKRLPDRVAAVKRRDKCLRILFTGCLLYTSDAADDV